MGAATPSSATVLSIVVPVGPGDPAWRALLPLLLPLPAHCEILLVAGERCPDDAASVSAATGARWLSCAVGRAVQQNTGAAQARGALLWFLHCDSQPDRTALASAAALGPPFDALGWFRLAFHDGGWPHRLNALGANLRAAWLALPFGDQGLLLSARRFRALGGFDEALPRGEDLDLVLRSRAAGVPLRRLAGRVATSARRYRQHGWWRTTHQHLHLTRSLRRAALARLRGDPA